jgi:hypothetical protein
MAVVMVASSVALLVGGLADDSAESLAEHLVALSVSWTVAR